MCIDPRGFKTFIQEEATSFVTPSQVLLNSTITEIAYSPNGVEVTLKNGTKLTADYALTTFSLGGLQNDDVTFNPALPSWQQEAIQTMEMVGLYSVALLL